MCLSRVCLSGGVVGNCTPRVLPCAVLAPVNACSAAATSGPAPTVMACPNPNRFRSQWHRSCGRTVTWHPQAADGRRSVGETKHGERGRGARMENNFCPPPCANERHGTQPVEPVAGQSQQGVVVEPAPDALSKLLKYLPSFPRPPGS